MRHLRSMLLPAALSAFAVGAAACTTAPAPGSADATADPAAGTAAVGTAAVGASSSLTDTVATAVAATPRSADAEPSARDHVAAFPLRVPEGAEPLWASVRWCDFGGGCTSYVAVHARRDGAWTELDRFDVACQGMIPTVSQARLGGEGIWLAVESAGPATLRCLEVQSFDGDDFRAWIDHQGAETGALEDLDGDGVLEVVLDVSDPYVYCGACGVTRRAFEVHRWDGEELAEVELRDLPESVPEAPREANRRAVALARGGLWKDAVEAIETARSTPLGPDLAGEAEIVDWNRRIIGMHAEARRAHVAESAAPLLAQLFYGDYEAALDTLRAHEPAALFAADTPAFDHQFAHQTYDHVIRATSDALAADPRLAPAYFVRGWMTCHPPEREGTGDGTGCDNAAVADLEHAAALDPEQWLYRDALAHVRR